MRMKKTASAAAAMLLALAIIGSYFRYYTGYWNPNKALEMAAVWAQAEHAILNAKLYVSGASRSGPPRIKVYKDLTEDSNPYYEAPVFDSLRVYPGGIIEVRFHERMETGPGVLRFYPVLSQSKPPRVQGWRCEYPERPRFSRRFADCVETIDVPKDQP